VIEGYMLDRPSLISKIHDPCHIVCVYNLHNQFTVVMVSLEQQSSSAAATYSDATAAHNPSGEIDISLMGRVLRTSTSSREWVNKEYLQTLPSSEPVKKKSLVAATAVWES
jgi:hypothetical protein